MSTVAVSIYKTLSKAQVVRLENLGASLSSDKKTLTATEDQMWKSRIIANQRKLLEQRGNLAVSTNFP